MRTRDAKAHGDDDEAPDQEVPELHALDVDGRDRHVVEDSDDHDRDDQRNDDRLLHVLFHALALSSKTGQMDRSLVPLSSGTVIK